MCLNVLLSLSHFSSLCYLCVLQQIAFWRLRGFMYLLPVFREQKKKLVIVILPISTLDMLLGWYCCSLVSRAKSFIVSSLNQLLQPKVSGVVLTIELPSRCYSGPNEHFKAIGQAACNLLTVMAVFAWLGVLTSKSCLWTIPNKKLQSFHLQWSWGPSRSSSYLAKSSSLPNYPHPCFREMIAMPQVWDGWVGMILSLPSKNGVTPMFDDECCWTVLQVYLTLTCNMIIHTQLYYCPSKIMIRWTSSSSEAWSSSPPGLSCQFWGSCMLWYMHDRDPVLPAVS